MNAHPFHRLLMQEQKLLFQEMRSRSSSAIYELVFAMLCIALLQERSSILWSSTASSLGRIKALLRLLVSSLPAIWTSWWTMLLSRHASAT